MYKELVTLLRKKYDKAPLVMAAADAIEGLSKQIELEHQNGFADGQIAANRKKTHWVSVFDRLPADGVSVVCWLRNDEGECYASIGWYDTKFRMWELDSEYSLSRHVTHWMPLPIAPED